MKKFLSVILALMLLAALAGCGSNEPSVTVEAPAEEEPAQVETPAVEVEEEATTEDEGAPVEEPEDPGFDEEKYNIAAAYNEGESMDGLIEKIGEPNSEDYAPGCSGHEEEGILYYDGFIVYTYRDNGYVTFYMVEKD